jgi:hypothetical protein
MEDKEYFKAVVETAKLISIWLNKKEMDIKKIISSVEVSLETKHGPFTSKLSNHIGINETLGLKNQDIYWNGVQDTLNLLKNFLNWKSLTASPRTYENFILEIINKSKQKIVPDESPLISALGISFDTEFANDLEIEAEKSERTFESILTKNIEEIKPGLDVIQATTPKKLVTEVPILEKSDKMTEPKSDDERFNSKEFINDDEFLDQFISDSINLNSEEKHEEIIVGEKDYLRSALDELNKSDEKEEDEKEVEIKFKDGWF